MKHNKIFSIVAMASVALGFSACKPNVPSIEESFYADDSTSIEALTKDGKLYSLNEFKATFMTEEGNYHSDTTLYRKQAATTDNSVYVFSMDTIREDGPGIYIMGRVITDDYGGNFYKNVIIQQIDSAGQPIPQQALRVSVNVGSISGMYPRGQKILIRCNGFAIGRYSNQPTLCVPSYNNNVYAMNFNKKVGWTPGAIPMARFQKATKLIGKPDASKVHYDTVQIADFWKENKPDIKAHRNDDAKAICICNIHYTGEYYDDLDSKLKPCTTGDPEKDKTANVFAPTTTNIGYPQSRVIYNQDENYYISVSMSEYAKEAKFYLPGASAPEQGDVFFYDENATPDLTQPFLLATLDSKYKNIVVPVDNIKMAQDWQVDDVIYLNADKTIGYVCISANQGQYEWSKNLGIVHCKDYVGTIHGILSFYCDDANPQYGKPITSPHSWGISICDLSDLDLYKKDAKGNKVAWTPLEYTPN